MIPMKKMKMKKETGNHAIIIIIIKTSNLMCQQSDSDASIEANPLNDPRISCIGEP